MLPVLLLIVFGTIQFGIAFNRVHGLQAAAREAARLASVGASRADVEDRARDTQSLFNDDDVDIAVLVAGSQAPDPPCSRVGDIIEVELDVDKSQDYAITIPLFGSHELNYKASASYRCERNGSA